MTSADSPSATPAYTPLLTDLSRLGRVLFSPTAVFEAQKDKPTIWMPWVVISLFTALIGLFLTKPYTMKLMELQTQAAGRSLPESAAQIGLVISLITVPVIFLALASINAGAMWVAFQLSAGEVRFRSLMSASMFAMIMGIIQMLASWAVLNARGGPEAMEGPQDMQSGLGLNLLLSPDAQTPRFLEGILSGIGPLQVWSLIITIYGVAALEMKKPGSVLFPALAAYLVMLVLGAVFYGRGG